MRHGLFKRTISALLILCMIFGLFPISVAAVQADVLHEETKPATKAAATGPAEDVGVYHLVESIPEVEGCYTQQGMGLLGDYIYSAQISSGDAKAVIYRTSRLTGETVPMTIDGATYSSKLGHANDICCAVVGNDSYLFVTVLKDSTGDLNKVVCFKITDTALTTVATYTTYTEGGSALNFSGISTYKVDGNKVTLLVTHARQSYLATFDVTAGDCSVTCEFVFQLDNTNFTETGLAAAGFACDTLTVQGSCYADGTFYMPLGMGHSNVPIDNHGDAVQVILVYPDIDEAIASKNNAVTTTVENAIRVPHPETIWSDIESVAVEDGILYFNTTRILLDESTVTSISFITDEYSKVIERRQAFEYESVYLLTAPSNSAYIMVDVGAEDGHLEIQNVTPSKSAWFGFENNGQGYYYIKNIATQKYLTVNDDGSVTQSATKTGSLNQLWSITQTGWPTSNTNVAILSLYDTGTKNYLNQESMIVTTNSTGKTFVLQEALNKTNLENYLFDLELYNACYPDSVGMTRAEGIAHYKSTGLAEGRVASVFFDPIYYLENHPDLGLTTYQEAYDHFVNYGFWEGRQGSLFFSCNEYINHEGGLVSTGIYPEKSTFLWHFYTYGATNSITNGGYYGSDEFKIQDILTEYALTATDGYDFLVDYISRNVVLSTITTQEELEELLFDAEYYQLKNPNLNEDNSALMNMGGATLEENLEIHWNRYGKSEGRIASPYYSSAYYRTKYSDVGSTALDAYNHFVTTGFWEGRASSVYSSNRQYLYGLYPEPDSLCPHLQTVTTTTPKPTCSSNGLATTYCCECSIVLKTTKLAALEHTDSDIDNICDVCGVDFAGSLVLFNQVNTLVDPVATNEYYDLTGCTFDSNAWDGLYYLVQEGSDGVTRIFDTLNQSNRLGFPATTVTVKGNAIYGAEPGMAIELIFVSAGTNEGTFNIKINEDYYLGYGANTTTGTYGEARRESSARSLGLRVVTETYLNRMRIYRKIEGTPHWLRLQEQDGYYFYRFNSNVSACADNTFYLYKLLTDRLHTESMYATIKEAGDYVSPNAAYDTVAYNEFLTALKKCLDLYEKYNGTVLTGTDLSNKDALQEAFDAKERELINLMSILKINSDGKSIRYFLANMYNYNEDNMNALVDVMTGADTAGFYFESGKNKNTTAFYSVYDGTTSEVVKGRTIRSQMYSITSGIAASDLSTATNPPFANTVVTTDFWSTTPIENAKDVYTDVGVPFMYEDGYYILNSDTNAVFFEGEPISGANLAISELPAAYYWSGGMTHGVASPDYVESDYTTFEYSDGYVTGFQPFAKMTNRKAAAYTADASVFDAGTPVDSYLIDGVAFRSATDPVLEAAGSGDAVWGFGMKLDVNFKMTDDGCLDDEAKTPITFEFSGDDDIWVYIDGKLVLDIGGSHDAIQGVINFTDGSVIVRSDKYDRVRDKNTSGYGWSDSGKYDATQLSDVHSIITNQMYQKNLYTEVFNKTIEEFANDGQSHTLTVYYMDRGKGRTNSMIKFNLPQTDTITVNKEVKCATYENSILTEMSEEASSALMQTLGAMSFEYTLTDSGAAMANQTYQLFENGIKLSEQTTNANGKFTLKHGQSAVFNDLNFSSEHAYEVVETVPTSTWFDISWSHTTTGDAAATAEVPNYYTTTYNSNISAKVTIDGDLHANETITFNCTNTFVDVPLAADEIIVDYGKTMQIDVLENDPSLLYLIGYTRTLQGFAAYDENLDAITSYKKAGSSTFTLDNGTLSISDGKVLFTPTKLLETAEKVFAVIKYTKGTDVFYLYEELCIMPATVMYYESDFTDLVDTESHKDFVLIDFGPDDTTTWTSTSSGITVTKDTANGLFRGTVDSATTPFAGMVQTSDQLNYLLRSGDEVYVRLRVMVESSTAHTGIQIFMATEENPRYAETTSVKDSTQTAHFSSEFITLHYPVNQALVGQTLTAIRVDPFDGASNVKATYEIDYIYVGPTATAPTDNYLFFDFDNGTDDQLRYKQEQYGGFNYDEANWAASTKYSIDNTSGTLTVNATTSSDGPYLSVTNTTGTYPWSSGKAYAPLSYQASKNETMQLRFKITDCNVAGGTDATVYVVSHSTRGGSYRYTGGEQIVKNFEIVNGEYITLTIPMSHYFQEGDIIKTIGLWFVGLTTSGSGKIEIDYIYVGKEADYNKVMIHDRSAKTNTMGNASSDNYLYFDFDNSLDDQLRYMKKQYGGFNYDEANWASGASNGYSIDNTNGTLTVNVSSNTSYNGPYLSVTNTTGTYPWASGKAYAPLNYRTSGNETMHVRLKITDCNVAGGNNATAYVVSHSTRGGSYRYTGGEQIVKNFEIVNGEYITLTIPMSHYFQEGDIIKTIGLWFVGLTTSGSGKIEIDYIYVGKEENFNRAAFYDQSTWQIVTDDTAEDGLQDSGLANNDGYLLLDFNDSDRTVWNYVNAAASTGVKDTVNGVLKGKIFGNDPWIGMKRLGNQLSYTFKEGDVVQVRMKTTLTKPTTKELGFQFYYTTRESNNYDSTKRIYDNYYEHITGEYEVITLEVGEAHFGQTIADIRIDPVVSDMGTDVDGTYEVDYIYIGPKNRAPGNDAIFFDFNDDDLSRARYHSESYGGYNGDTKAWSGNAAMASGSEDGTREFAAKDTGKIILCMQPSELYETGFSLDYTPKSGDVFQVRVKLENFKAAGFPYVVVTGYSGATCDENDDDIDDAVEIVARQYLNTAWLTAGEYITITIPTNSNYTALSKISTFRLHFNEMTSISSTQLAKATIDYIYLGPESGLPTNGRMVLGYDSSYENDTKYSNGSSLYVEGVGVPRFNSDFTLKPATYNAASFSFTGTGFDILSRTGAQQGALRVVIYKADGTYVKTVSVVNKSEKNLELYQIPVVSVNDLTHGEYQVKIFVNAAYDYGNDGNTDDYGGALDRGNEFYFDAVRIYNPIDTSETACASSALSQLVREAYLKIGEADKKLTEVRKLLIDAESFTAGNDNIEGIVYLDNTDKVVSLANYEAFGPNNETYLATNQAIAFKLVAEGGIPASIDVGAKTIQANTANLTMGFSASKPDTLPSAQDRTVSSSTVQYYPLDIPASAWTRSTDATCYTYVIIRNAGGAGILSLTDVKAAADSVTAASAPTRSLRFAIDMEMLEALNVCTEHTLSYVDNGNDHTANCPACEYSVTEPHSYADGICICGAVEVMEPKYEPDENLKFTMNISAGAEMTVSYNIMANAVNTYKDFYLEVTKEVAGGESITTIYGITEDREAMTVKTDPTTGEALMYQVTYKGINAKEMGDNFSTTLYAVGEDGTIYYGETVVDSIKSFLVEKLDAESSIPELKTMAVDMLKYGAAAQVRLGYNTENLVTADLTENQLSYATKEIPEAVNNAASTGEGASVNTNITVTSRVQLNLSCVYPTATNPDAIKCVVTDSEGKVLAEIAATNKDNIMFTAIYENVGAKQMRDVINATFYEGETAISKTISWSVESYVAQVRAKTNVTEDEVNMVNAMLTYGDSAAVYLSATNQ